MCFASFAADVVLPEPWSPTRATTAGLPTRRKVRSPGREERGELLVDDLDDLLAGGEALEDLGADGPLADPRDEVLDDLEVDVRLEQREADLAHRRVDVRLGHATTTGQPGEGLAEAVTEAVEHAETATLCCRLGSGRTARGRAGGARVLATPGSSECSPRVRDCRPGALAEVLAAND